MKVDINLPVMILQTKEIAEYFRAFLLNKAVNKPLKVSNIYGNLSYNGLNITEGYGWTFQDLLKIRIMKCRTGYYLDIPNPIKFKDFEPTEVDDITYPEPRIHVVYEELEMDDLWRVTSLHRKDTI